MFDTFTFADMLQLVILVGGGIYQMGKLNSKFEVLSKNQETQNQTIKEVNTKVDKFVEKQTDMDKNILALEEEQRLTKTGYDAVIESARHVGKAITEPFKELLKNQNGN